MTHQEKPPKAGSAINIGIYGCTKAGKTRFLFQLLDQWKQQDRLLLQSEQALLFLERVRTEIETTGGSMPTVATTEGIQVRVRRDRNDPPLALIFRDLRGELLADELDEIDSLNPKGVIPTQVQKCDAFLFFFDPASSENPAGIDKHHQRELKRATMFIEYILRVRENHHLPLVFVLTHLDQWESKAHICEKADRWCNEVHAKLSEFYDTHLRRIYPKSLVDRKRIFHHVSSVGKTPEANKRVEEVIDQLVELVADSESYRKRLRKQGVGALIAGALAILICICLFLGMWLFAPPGVSPLQPSVVENRLAVAEMPEREILTKLDDLERLLKAHPPGKQLPTVEEAKKLNYHLQWLTQRLYPDSDGTAALSEKTVERMRSALESVAKLIQAKADNDLRSATDITPVLGAYLEDLPDLASTSPVLAAAQARYWQLQRAQVVEQLASIIKRRHEVGSSPTDTLGEIITKLRAIEQEVGRVKVFGPQARQKLLHEVQVAATFCEDRKKSNSYPISFRVISASDSQKKQGDLALRSVRIMSPNRSDWLARDGVALIPNINQIPVDITATVHWGPTCWNGYDNLITIQIGEEEPWQVTAISEPGGQMQLGTKRIKAKRNDKLCFNINIRIINGIFIFSSREHGSGEYEVQIGDLLDEYKVVTLDRCGNWVVVSAKSAGKDEANAFHTKQPSYNGELGLGMPITCVLSVHDSVNNQWLKLDEFDLASEQGPLTPLGMPLLRQDQLKVTKVLRRQGRELHLELFDFPKVPQLLWDAATRERGRP